MQHEQDPLQTQPVVQRTGTRRLVWPHRKQRLDPRPQPIIHNPRSSHTRSNDQTRQPSPTTSTNAEDPVRSSYGALESTTYSNNSFQSKLTNWHDEATGRLTRTVVGDETNPVANTNYTYNDVGTITRIEEDVKNDTQCFGYDRLQRLTDAWTPSSEKCSDAPDAENLGGPAPYWKTYGHDDTGNRISLTDNTTGATTAYKQTDTAHPHAVTSASTSTAATTDTPFIRNFQYDDAGNMKARTSPSGTEQSLTWDVEGRLATIADAAGSSTNIYGADGERLIRRDPKGATLYLPGQEIRYDTATNSRSCARYYTHAGSVFAVRTTAGGLQWLFNDHQGTASVAINQGNPQVLTYRYQDPYGNPRGTSVAWPGERGFQNGVNDPSGLTHIGAREYDGTLGRFISDDPVAMTENRQQLHGYAYASNSPLSVSDPSGLAQDPDMPQGTYAAEAWVNSDSYHPPSYYAPPPPPEPEGDDCWGWSWTCEAIDSADRWITDNAGIVGAVVGIAAGAMCMSIATGATFGVAAAPAAVGCGMLAGAIGSAVTSNIEGDSIDETVTESLEGAVIGGALGILGPLAGAAKNAARALPGAVKALPGAVKALPGALKGLPSKLIPNATAKAASSVRESYVEEVSGLKKLGETLLGNGASPELTARVLSAQRRIMGAHYKAKSSPEMLATIYERNLAKYGDELGPTVNWLRGEGKTWEQIIESSSRTGGRDLGL
ncbi:RHS repeat domain-containing protein [Phytomonospora endophytica]|uniref:RHS repeat-associated protein n=1 Tax=Phytomonospora endophytica TaxID=714109 RepID=A0A841FYZ2_9ACTN|nr:RHS repeat-associated core domain-containing protein [Phytomonospora endophytica]MBB6038567.1 RHS repeat-associated protein [Phytomonospora endophytica]GIG69292.1 hypothetical protein Pen01_55870 [Phytomonospora endophytica]